jgi:hypothetical protein
MTAHTPSVDAVLEAFLTPRRAAATPEENALLGSARTDGAAVDGQRLRVWQWGRGEHAVLLVHGWDSRGSHLAGFVGPLLRAGLRVVAFDALAHGDSDGAWSTVAHHARSVRAVADRAGPVSAVIAHSVGSPASLLAFRSGLAVRASVHMSGPASLARVAAGVAGAAGLPADRVPQFLAAVERRAGLPLAAADLPSIAEGLAHPGLLLHDPEDREIPFAESERLAAHWPAAVLVPTGGLGHRRILRDPGVIERVVDFVAQSVSRDPVTEPCCVDTVGP